MSDDVIPRPIVVQIVDNFRELAELQRQQSVTQAEMIRWCVQELRSDPQTHRMRGHEGYAQRQATLKENLRNRERALIYLDWLATRMEDEGAV